MVYKPIGRFDPGKTARSSSRKCPATSGPICATTASEKEKLLRLQVEEVFAAIDEDKSGTISRKEFGQE